MLVVKTNQTLSLKNNNYISQQIVTDCYEAWSCYLADPPCFTRELKFQEILIWNNILTTHKN